MYADTAKLPLDAANPGTATVNMRMMNSTVRSSAIVIPCFEKYRTLILMEGRPTRKPPYHEAGENCYGVTVNSIVSAYEPAGAVE